MRIHSILLSLAMLTAGCSRAVDQQATEAVPSAGGRAAGQGTDIGGADPRSFTGVAPAGQRRVAEPENDDEDGLRTPIARAIRDSLNDLEDGSQEEHEAILNSLKENDEILAEASGQNAHRKILESNNTHRGRRVVVPPNIN